MTEDTDLLDGLEALEGKLAQARASITRRFIGQEQVVDFMVAGQVLIFDPLARRPAPAG